MDPLLIPVQLAIIALYVWRYPLIDHPKEPARTRLLVLAADVKCHIGAWWKTLLVPVLVTVVTYVVWLYYCLAFSGHLPDLTITDPLLLYVIESCVLAPVAEEILQCVFLSAMFLLIARLYRNRAMVVFMMVASLMIIAFIFANAHINPAPVNWLVRFFQFMIYGGLYNLNGRNMLPAIVAHAAWNGLIAAMAVA